MPAGECGLERILKPTHRLSAFATDNGWSLAHTVVVAMLLAILFLPFWRDRVDAFYVIEPIHSHTLHAAVMGRVNEVMVREGERVHAGQPLLRMSSPMAASMQSSAAAQVGSARFQTFNAQLQGQSIGPAAAEQTGAAHFAGLAHEAQSSLLIAAPSDGIIMTQNPGLLLDQDVASGQPMLDLADAGPRVLRIFIPAWGLDRISRDAKVSLSLPGEFSVLHQPLPLPGAAAETLPPGLIPQQNFKGIQLAVYYCSRVTLPATDGNPMFGASGRAKIFGVRRSIAERAVFILLNLIKSHVW